MNEREIDEIKTLRKELERLWWGCETTDAEGLLSGLIDAVDTKLGEK